ncbi:hypothetical protein IWQ62_001587 [Dispira parvispora]|uniref:sphingomyelin phosphodiesterase n=1 Tax=Dispira parvispora TaxID=1520584 RepID=A0A9W8AS09_9FUNG|nr:hypothetical protein IWQ62_001587 [Dispira parvispora]
MGSSTASSYPLVRILTLNLFMRPPGIKTNASDYKDARLDYVIKHVLPQYDVISFQELFSFMNSRVDHLLRAARAAGFGHFFRSKPKSVLDFSIDGGLLTISRFPIMETDSVTYPRGKYSDWMAAKGALYTKIELSNRSHLHLFTTHTQASYEQVVLVDCPTAMIRRTQFQILHDFVVRKTRDTPVDEPIIIQGDLNVNARVDGKISSNAKDSRSSEEYDIMMGILRGEPTTSANSRSPLTLSPTPPSRENHASNRPPAIHFRDILYDTLGYHPVTFGDIVLDHSGVPKPRDCVLSAGPCSTSCQRLDYILWGTKSANVGNGVQAQDSPFSDSSQSFKAVPIRTYVAPIYIDDGMKGSGNCPVTQISDHYGVACEVQLKD